MAIGALFAIVDLAARTTHAQGVDSLAPKRIVSTDVALQADYVANAGDSIAAYKMLDSAVRANKRDAAAWHRYGMLAWSMGRSSRGAMFSRSAEGTRFMLAADSAMHLAVTFAPDSAAYWRDLARFYLNSGSVFVRFRAQDYVTKGLNAAVKQGDSILVAELADERGMILWRRYEDDENSPASVADVGRERRDNMIARSKSKDRALAAKVTAPPRSFSGFANYTQAMEMFERSVGANPLYARARHHIYMAYAERKRWPDLLAVSTNQIAKVPWDFEAWLAKGLAHQRLNNSVDAAAAFDSALVLMTPEVRGEYTRVTRILRPKGFGQNAPADTDDFARLNPDGKKIAEGMYWSIVDPRSAAKQNDFRTEFYARVAYSDLMWTSDDLDHRGADSDRGNIHIRFGPADEETKSGCSAFICEYWKYRMGLSFVFAEAATFGSGFIPNLDRPRVEDIINQYPVRWDNVPSSRLIENMGMRVTAFRGTKDSVDVVIAADVPSKRLLAGSDLGGAMPFNVSARVVDSRINPYGLQNSTRRFNSDSVPTSFAQSWIERIGPGTNLVRVEVYQPDTRRNALALQNIDETRATGFGISDILLSNGKVVATEAVERWRDVKAEPSSGIFRVGDPIGLLWENYELAANGSDSRYQIDILVEPLNTTINLSSIIARVRSSFSNAILGQAQGSGNVTMSFPRTAPARAISVEALTLDLGKLQPGRFTMTVEVTDLVSSMKTQRTLVFRVVE